MSDLDSFQGAPEEVDVVGKVAETCRLEWATVGWSDKDDWFDTNDDPDDGTTLVRVTSFAGRTAGTPIEPGVAAGTQYLAQIMGPFWRIPKKGEKCIIGIPSGMEQTPGSVVILGFPGAAPGNQYSKTRAKMDLGDIDFVMKARSLTFTDNDNRFLHVGPDLGICIQEKDGSGVMVKDGAVVMVSSDGTTVKSMMQLKTDGIDMSVTGGACMQMDAQKCHIFAVNCYVQGAGVYLGATFSPGSAATSGCGYGPNAPPAAPTSCSATVFISP